MQQYYINLGGNLYGINNLTLNKQQKRTKAKQKGYPTYQSVHLDKLLSLLHSDKYQVEERSLHRRRSLQSLAIYVGVEYSSLKNLLLRSLQTVYAPIWKINTKIMFEISLWFKVTNQFFQDIQLEGKRGPRPAIISL